MKQKISSKYFIRFTERVEKNISFQGFSKIKTEIYDSKIEMEAALELFYKSDTIAVIDFGRAKLDDG